jgi:hypothetical protein
VFETPHESDVQVLACVGFMGGAPSCHLMYDMGGVVHSQGVDIPRIRESHGSGHKMMSSVAV